MDARDEIVRRITAAYPLLRRLQTSVDLPAAEYHLLDGLLDVVYQHNQDTSRRQVLPIRTVSQKKVEKSP